MRIERFRARDGVEIACHVLGEGPPVVLLHGFLSSARRNWIRPGIAQATADLGRLVICPDLRGHGRSEAPTDPAYWPSDVLARDQLDLAAHFGLSAFDLCGYSLGARTAVRACADGLAPRRLLLGGMGEQGIIAAGPRAEMFEDAIRHGEAAKDPAMGKAIQEILVQSQLKAEAMLGVLASFRPTTEAEIRAIACPSLVLIGEDDHDNGSAATLAEWLPQGRLTVVPGDHGAAVTAPEFAAAMTAFLH
jgi:pimeloyl-ACP methyl ester carboxylesterase